MDSSTFRIAAVRYSPPASLRRQRRRGCCQRHRQNIVRSCRARHSPGAACTAHSLPKAPQQFIGMHSATLIFMPPRLQFGIGRLFRIVPFRFLFVLFLVLMCIVNFSWMTALYSRGQKGPYPISRIQSAALVFFPTAGAADNNFCACYSPSSSLNDITSFSAGSSPSSPYEHTQS